MTKAETRGVVVVGAAMVGAACARCAVSAGPTVTVIARGPVAPGSTGSGCRRSAPTHVGRAE